jgi:hypothetical protein
MKTMAKIEKNPGCRLFTAKKIENYSGWKFYTVRGMVCAYTGS